jgi:hypothetical protein
MYDEYPEMNDDEGTPSLIKDGLDGEPSLAYDVELILRKRVRK